MASSDSTVVRITPGGIAIAAACLVSVGLGFALKQPCITHEWGPPERPYQYEHYCYSDILPLWFGKGLDHDVPPYTGTDINQPGGWEYPVLTGYFAFGIAKMTEGLTAYMELTNVLLSLAAAGVAVAMWRIGATHTMMAAYAIAPTVPLHSITNWDMLAVLPAMWGWFLWRRGRQTSNPRAAFTYAAASAFLFGLGGAAKLYPAFFLPFLAVDTVGRKDWPGTGAVAAGGFLGLVVPNLIAALQNREAWWVTYKFHLERSPDFETPWEALIRPWAEKQWPSFDWDHGWTDLVGKISMVIFALTFLLLAWRILKGKLTPLAAAGIFAIVFVLFNKVYSPQYTLWLLPLLILLRASWIPVGLFVLADAWNVWIRYQYFTDYTWRVWSERAVNFRWLFLAICLGTILWHYGVFGRRTIMSPPDPSTDRTKPTNEPITP